MQVLHVRPWFCSCCLSTVLLKISDTASCDTCRCQLYLNQIRRFVGPPIYQLDFAAHIDLAHRFPEFQGDVVAAGKAPMRSPIVEEDNFDVGQLR